MRQRVRFIAGGLACILVLWLVRPGWAAKTRVAKPPVADTPAADAVVTQPVAVADTVSGRVFLDANGNGRLDPGEQGLAGVAVTDGVSFVTTAADGSYTIKIGDDPVLPHRSTHTVSVCWPSGKWPTGKWWGRLDQIADPKNLNFGLREDPQKRPFSFVQVSDNHGGPYVGFANELKQLGPEVKFLFNTGDLFYANYSGPADANLTYQRYVASTLPGLPLPLFHTPGNHDLCGTNIKTDKTHPDYCNGVFTKYLGPIRWSFDYAGAHFVGLDWRCIAPNGVYESGCPQSAIDWLDKDLARVKPGATIIGFIHFPYSPFNFWETLGKYKVTRVLGGHSHRYERLESHGVVATTVLNLRDAACQIGIVGEAGLEIVDRCPGCGKGGAASHSKYCALVSSSLAAPPGRPGRELSAGPEERHQRCGGGPGLRRQGRVDIGQTRSGRGEGRPADRGQANGRDRLHPQRAPGQRRGSAADSRRPPAARGLRRRQDAHRVCHARRAHHPVAPRGPARQGRDFCRGRDGQVRFVQCLGTPGHGNAQYGI